MEDARTNPGSPAMVAVVGPRRGPSPRVTSALAGIDANVSLIQTMRQLRAVCREYEPDLVVLELPELTAARLNAEIDLLRGAGIQAPIFVISNGILPGDGPVLITDVVDFATAQATASEIHARIYRILEHLHGPMPDPDSNGDAHAMTIDGVRLDWRARQATVDGRTVKFTSSELRLLEAFLKHRGELLSTGTLLRAVWGENRRRSDNLVAVYIFALRGKLHRLGAGLCIENKVGFGYRLTTGIASPRRKKSGGPRSHSTKRSA